MNNNFAKMLLVILKDVANAICRMSAIEKKISFPRLTDLSSLYIYSMAGIPTVTQRIRHPPISVERNNLSHYCGF